MVIFSGPKNWRNGREDVSTPLQHADTRRRFTKIGFGGVAVVIGPGPSVVPVPSVYQEQRND
jgi:hypothetical protein